MAKNKIDNCMFCGENPCTCLGPVKKAAKKRAPRTPKQASTPAGSSDDLPAQPVAKVDPAAAMRAAAQKAAEARAEVSRLAERPESGEAGSSNQFDDPEFRAAVATLGPILHPEERDRYSDLLGSASRVQAWRTRNGR